MECPPVGAFLAVNGDRGGAAKRKPRREMTNAAKNAIVTECADVVDVAVDVAADVAGDVAFAESERNPQSLDSFFFLPFSGQKPSKGRRIGWDIFQNQKKKRKKKKSAAFEQKHSFSFGADGGQGTGNQKRFPIKVRSSSPCRAQKKQTNKQNKQNKRRTLPRRSAPVSRFVLIFFVATRHRGRSMAQKNNFFVGFVNLLIYFFFWLSLEEIVLSSLLLFPILPCGGYRSAEQVIGAGVDYKSTPQRRDASTPVPAPSNRRRFRIQTIPPNTWSHSVKFNEIEWNPTKTR